MKKSQPDVLPTLEQCSKDLVIRMHMTACNITSLVAEAIDERKHDPTGMKTLEQAIIAVLDNDDLTNQ